MGKKPFFGMVSFCWLGLALAGCDTFNSNSTVPKDRFAGQARSTFGNNTTKDATLSKGTTLPDSTVQPKTPDSRFVQDRPAGFDTGTPAVGAGGGLTSAPPKPTDRFDATRMSGQRTPGAAGLVDAPTGSGAISSPTISDSKKTLPRSGADDGLKETSLESGELPPSRGVTPAGPSGVSLPPAPSANQPPAVPQRSLPPLSLQQSGEARPSPRPLNLASPTEPTPPAPEGAKTLDAPPQPTVPAALKPAEPVRPTYDVPAPSVTPALKPGELSPAATDGVAPPPAPPPGPFMPSSPK
jgi:hypothetical protein